MKSFVHIYCGNGKGKTSAATGLAVRAAGSGMKVLFARFLKNEQSAELKVLDGIEGIEVVHLHKEFGFYQTLSKVQKEEQLRYYRELWQELSSRITGGSYQMLILDEIMAVTNYNIIRSEQVLELVQNRPEDLEIVMTGRNPDETLIRTADYVSEIQKVKHPFDKGVTARKGIEY